MVVYTNEIYKWVAAGPRGAVGRAPDSWVRGYVFDTRSGGVLSFLLPLFREGRLSVAGEGVCAGCWLTAWGVWACPGEVWLGWLAVPA